MKVLSSIKPRDKSEIEAMDDGNHLTQRELDYFKSRLIKQKSGLLEKLSQSKKKLKQLQASHSDIIDKSNFLLEVEHTIRSHERYYRDIKQIDAALERIKKGSFGYCQLTGNRIEFKRLEILPFTTVCVQALEEMEYKRQLQVAACF